MDGIEGCTVADESKRVSEQKNLPSLPGDTNLSSK